jgi:carboxyl-terminal processing protease
VSRSRSLLFALVVVLVGVGGFFAGRLTVDQAVEFEEVATAAEGIERRALVPPTREDLVRGAIRGMLETLDDPYAAILGPEEAAAARDLSTGSFVGIGAFVEGGPEGLVVTSVLQGSPAGDAGIVPGDLLTTIDGRPMAGLTAAQAAPILSGAEGSTARLVVRTEGSEREVTVVRARISLSDVQARMLEGQVAYARALQFGEGVAGDLRRQIGRLLDQGARGLVLDLRGNPGGVVDEAVATASLFLADGSVARIQEAGEEEQDLPVSGDPLPEVPMAVVVDGGTAGAAELVAGALQDRGRATLVGIQTFGKGSVLEVQDLEASDEAIRFTSATFLTPSGGTIEGRGLIPDVALLPGGPTDAQVERAVQVVLAQQTA